MITVKQIFKPNDVVRYIPMGDKEYVLQYDETRKLFPFFILINGNLRVNLSNEGLRKPWHTHPLLILIRRPEEKKKWYQVFYKCHNEEMPQNASCLYNSEDDFYTRGISKNRLEWIELAFVCER